MGFMREVHGKDYAANSRETIRRQTIHQFEQARIVDRNPDDPDRPTNSGKTVYVLTEETADVLKAYGTAAFDGAVRQFIEQFGSLKMSFSTATSSPGWGYRSLSTTSCRMSFSTIRTSSGCL